MGVCVSMYTSVFPMFTRMCERNGFIFVRRKYDSNILCLTEFNIISVHPTMILLYTYNNGGRGML